MLIMHINHRNKAVFMQEKLEETRSKRTAERQSKSQVAKALDINKCTLRRRLKNSVPFFYFH
jgi:DNA invertase Pin-like site-specific DNA recombinase